MSQNDVTVGVHCHDLALLEEKNLYAYSHVGLHGNTAKPFLINIPKKSKSSFEQPP